MAFLSARNFIVPGFFILVCLFLSGCATDEARRLPTLVAATQPALAVRTELTSPPYFPQVDANCGPAALATVLQQRGVNVTPEGLIPQVYLPGRRGSLQVEMLAAARRQGVLAVRIPATLEAVLREVADGTPVLVLQNLGLDWSPSWHYAVVVGYDLASEEFILRSGAEPRMRITFSVFDRTWTRAGRWAIVLPQVGIVPPTATADEMAAALAALERQQATLALPYYRSATVRWPLDVRFPFALANTLYAIGEKAAAGEAWSALLQRFPDHVPTLNNLATLRLEEGRMEDAQRLAERAVSIIGPWQNQARATLDEIRQAADPGLHRDGGL